MTNNVVLISFQPFTMQAEFTAITDEKVIKTAPVPYKTFADVVDAAILIKKQYKLNMVIVNAPAYMHKMIELAAMTKNLPVEFLK